MQVTNSDSTQQQPYGGTSDTPAAVQQTRSSEGLGLHISNDPTQTQARNDEVMAFLKSEAAGSTYDSNVKSGTDYHMVWQASFVLVLCIAMAALLLFYQRLFSRRLSTTK